MKTSFNPIISASLAFLSTLICAVAANAAPQSCPVDGGKVTINTRVGPTGFIEIVEFGIFADFHEDDQIITASNAPNCVAWVRSSNKPLSPAGDPFQPGPDITASSSFYQANPIQIEPDSTNFYLFNDVIFDATASATVTLETQGNVSVPRIPPLTLHAPGPGKTEMINPVNPKPLGTTININAGEDYVVAWKPLIPAPAKTMAVSLFQIVASSPFGSSKISYINCVFPYTAGQGKIPTSLLSEIRTRTLNGQPSTTPVDAIPGIQAFAGDARIINLRDASYFINAYRTDAVDQIFPNGASLDRPSVDCDKGNVKYLGCTLPFNGRLN